ncbi:MAG TPA: hypothetical protein DEH22_03780, partial [Chloroflexi bacterium]|nr:hypothetical protein [Chloroflexota bacterium]
MANKNFTQNWLIPLLALALLACSSGDAEGQNLLAPQVAQAADTPVSLRAQTGNEIEFQTQNGLAQFGRTPESNLIPQLTLYRNESLTEVAQRTLEIQINGVQLPSPGASVSLWVETQTGDPDATSNQGQRIPVWSESLWVAANPAGNTVIFAYIFGETIQFNDTRLPTPTGYFRYQICIETETGVLYTFEQDYAFLLENEWLAQLPQVPEETSGAAPDELVIYYSDMTPFQKDTHDPETWVARAAVRDYVGHALAPAFVAAFRLQSADWGFTWHTAWTGLRGAADAERLSVALTDGHTWYHGQAFPRGNSSISINVAGGE